MIGICEIMMCYLIRILSGIQIWCVNII